MTTIDEKRLQALLGRAVVDLGATFHAALAVVGDRLGLYKALASGGPMTPAELAARTRTTERYVQEWLGAQAAGGYVDYDPSTRRYSMSPEQAACLADENSPTFLPGGFQVALGAVRSLDRIAEAFETGAGVGWHEHDTCVFIGTERFFRPNYAANLVSEWIPALEGGEAALRSGARVADVGCGRGASTILMAREFPRSTFVGFDYHAESIGGARKSAEAAGVSGRVSFEVARASDFPGRYDLVAFFDSLHDMGDPTGIARHVLAALEPQGTWMIVEPFAGDRVEDNLNPVGRIFYSASTMLCCPNAIAQGAGSVALGAQAGEAKLREVVTAGGFRRFRRAAETPFNLVLEARP